MNFSRLSKALFLLSALIVFATSSGADPTPASLAGEGEVKFRAVLDFDEFGDANIAYEEGALVDTSHPDGPAIYGFGSSEDENGNPIGVRFSMGTEFGRSTAFEVSAVQGEPHTKEDVQQRRLERGPKVLPLASDKFGFALDAAMSDLAESEMVDVMVKVNLLTVSYTEQALLAHLEDGLSIDMAMEAGRSQALALRLASAEAVAENLSSDHGFELVKAFPLIGALRGLVPRSSLEALVESSVVAKVELADAPVNATPFQNHWNNRQLQAGTQMAEFRDHGYDGYIANPLRHNYGRVTIGVIDEGFYSDHPIYSNADNDPAPGHRIVFMSDCDNSTCTSVGGLGTKPNGDSHGLFVAGIMGGDLRDGQDDGITNLQLPPQYRASPMS